MVRVPDLHVITYSNHLIISPAYQNPVSRVDTDHQGEHVRQAVRLENVPSVLVLLLFFTPAPVLNTDVAQTVCS